MKFLKVCRNFILTWETTPKNRCWVGDNGRGFYLESTENLHLQYESL